MFSENTNWMWAERNSRVAVACDLINNFSTKPSQRNKTQQDLQHRSAAVAINRCSLQHLMCQSYRRFPPCLESLLSACKSPYVVLSGTCIYQDFIEQNCIFGDVR